MGTWKTTCNEIKTIFPELNHLANFGCQSKHYESTIKDFEELVKTLI